MEELSRSHIVSCGDELGEMPNFDICGTFFKDLFEPGLRTSIPKP